jgi:DNA polymerase-3 subunit alpha
MAKPDFVHLHVHSEYSLLDGANRIGDLVAACKEDGQGALALTDHGNMFGAIELYQKCTEAGVKPLIGCEVYVARQSMHEQHNKKKGNGYSHLTLIARDETGYKNLIRLASEAYVNGYHFRPRIDMQLLEQHARGITCLSGCLAGEINQLYLRDKESEAEAVAVHLRDLFGPEHFWIELQRNGIEKQTRVNESLYRLHQRTGMPIVATNDIHYLRRENCSAQDVLLCINTGAKRSDEKRFRFETDTLYFTTREEMSQLFHDLPGAVAATMDVAEQVDLRFSFGSYHVPVFQSDTGESPDVLFDRLLEERLLLRYGSANTAARERLEHEKKVIRDLGFVSYFLIVWDLIRWARENGIPVGPGRGSAAGSIVSYLLDVTRLDPLANGLLFERFLNSSRISMPDIDIDFCKDGRERVIEYTRSRFGAENVTQIVTFGTMASRTVIRDVGRVLDLPLRDIDRIAKKIPSGPGAPSLAEAVEKDAELAEIRRSSPQYEELFAPRFRWKGWRGTSDSRGWVVITPRPTYEYVPLARNGDDITTQYSAPQLELLGLLKMDYLGLRTLTILERALQNIRKKGGVAPDLDALPPGDPVTYRMLTAGDTLGVFQLESDGMKKLLGRLRPTASETFVAVLALYRPGPLESGMVDMFVRRKHKEEPIEYPHETLRGILAETYGCIVYQEQVMLTSTELAGFSMNDADNLRKAMGKKKPEIMQKFSAQFLEGAQKHGCPRTTAQEVWDNMVKFGGYGFNKSHSAAYALITYQTAYLKANHRTAFLAANLSCEMSDSDKVKDFVDDARRSGIAILPPDVESSAWEFEPDRLEALDPLWFRRDQGHRAESDRSYRCARESGAEKKSLTLHEPPAHSSPRRSVASPGTH